MPSFSLDWGNEVTGQQPPELIGHVKRQLAEMMSKDVTEK